jgi:hypothetical protein
MESELGEIPFNQALDIALRPARDGASFAIGSVPGGGTKPILEHEWPGLVLTYSDAGLDRWHLGGTLAPVAYSGVQVKREAVLGGQKVAAAPMGLVARNPRTTTPRRRRPSRHEVWFRKWEQAEPGAYSEDDSDQVVTDKANVWLARNISKNATISIKVANKYRA